MNMPTCSTSAKGPVPVSGISGPTTSKLVSPSLTSISVFSSFTTFACRGPSLISFNSFRTPSFIPLHFPAALPSEVFFTHPVRLLAPATLGEVSEEDALDSAVDEEGSYGG